MYSWITGRVVRALIKRLNAGETETIMRMFADDAHFCFPGRSSFAGDHHGKLQIGAWFDRFVGLGPSLVVHDVAAAGPPWNIRVLFRFSDRIPLPDGGEYENEGMEYMRIRWGKVREQRIYLDTEKVAEFDAQLAAAA
jgi:ketosteroid isomerase-like protein